MDGLFVVPLWLSSLCDLGFWRLMWPLSKLGVDLLVVILAFDASGCHYSSEWCDLHLFCLVWLAPESLKSVQVGVARAYFDWYDVGPSGGSPLGVRAGFNRITSTEMGWHGPWKGSWDAESKE